MIEKNPIGRLSVAVTGLGKMGLPMALQLAAKAFPVRGFDLNQNALDTLERVSLRQRG